MRRYRTGRMVTGVPLRRRAMATNARVRLGVEPRFGRYAASSKGGCAANHQKGKSSARANDFVTSSASKVCWMQIGALCARRSEEQRGPGRAAGEARDINAINIISRTDASRRFVAKNRIDPFRLALRASPIRIDPILQFCGPPEGEQTLLVQSILPEVRDAPLS